MRREACAILPVMDESTDTMFANEERDASVIRVEVVEGPDAGAEFKVSERSLLVGTGPNADVKLTDRFVSRLHCEIVRQGTSLRIKDLGAKNGCFAGETRIYEAELEHGTRIRLGDTVLAVRMGRARIELPVWRGGDRFGELVGGSAIMHALFARVARLAHTRVPVLVLGESGTGKELVARALHDHGPAAGGPFVVVDCGALSEQLADLELFGNVRGAFTGADRDRAGAFERAHGGTILLDEIGELSPPLQQKLLRVTEDQTVQRLGESVRRTIDVRVVAATHRPIARMVNDGTFREDLYYRVATVHVEVPPLRERGSDVSLLARHFADLLAPGDADALKRTEQALAARSHYPWPGNVRELRSFVRRVVLLGDLADAFAEQSEAGHGIPVCADQSYDHAKDVWLSLMTRRYVLQLLEETRGRVPEAAERAGLSVSHFYRMMRNLGIATGES
jgi:DNA-binding NtrC family response regulator